MAFKRNKRGYITFNHSKQCTSCGIMFTRRATSTMTICKACNNERVKSQPLEYKIYRRARERAKRDQRPFTLTVEDIIVPDICPVLLIPLVEHTGSSGGRSNSPSLDRVDNNKGYTPDNVQVISHRANSMKLDASPEELILFADWVYRTYKNE